MRCAARSSPRMMKTNLASAEKTSAISMRIASNRKNLIDYAAKLIGNDRTTFILDSATARAEEVILNKRLYILNDDDFDAFEAALESNRMEDNLCLIQRLSRPKSWVSPNPSN